MSQHPDKLNAIPLIIQMRRLSPGLKSSAQGQAGRAQGRIQTGLSNSTLMPSPLCRGVSIHASARSQAETSLKPSQLRRATKHLMNSFMSMLAQLMKSSWRGKEGKKGAGHTDHSPGPAIHESF